MPLGDTLPVETWCSAPSASEVKEITAKLRLWLPTPDIGTVGFALLHQGTDSVEWAFKNVLELRQMRSSGVQRSIATGLRPGVTTFSSHFASAF